MKAFARLAFAATLAACGGSDSSNSSTDPGTDAGADVPNIPGVPDGTFTLAIDDPLAIRRIVQTQSTELAIHVKRGSGIGPIAITVTGLPKDALAAPLSLDGNTNDATLKIVTAATTPQGESKFTVVAKATTTSAPDATVDIQAFVRGTPGSLDTTFGDGGIVAHPYPINTGDGKDVIVFPDGSSLFGTPLVKLTPSGAFDKTFGNQGVAVDAGKVPMTIDAVGRIYSLRETNGNQSGVILRTLANGQPDPAYTSSAGIDYAFGNTVDMVVAGSKLRVAALGGGVGAARSLFHLIQVNEDGTKDATWFPPVGTVTGDCTSNVQFGYSFPPKVTNGRISIDAAGNTNVVGTAFDATNNATGHKAFILACAPDGKTSTTYFLDTVGVNVDSVPLTGGGFLVLESGVGSFTLNANWARVDANGVRDKTIGMNGFIDSQITEANRIALQADGKVIVAGRSGSSGATDITLTRFNADGTLDSTFGNAGRVVTRVGNGTNDSQLGKIAFGPDGRIYVAGSHFDEPNASFIRYWN